MINYEIRKSKLNKALKARFTCDESLINIDDCKTVFNLFSIEEFRTTIPLKSISSCNIITKRHRAKGIKISIIGIILYLLCILFADMGFPRGIIKAIIPLDYCIVFLGILVFLFSKYIMIIFNENGGNKYTVPVSFDSKNEANLLIDAINKKICNKNQ